MHMHLQDALKLALTILEPFKESRLYIEYQQDACFSDPDYQAMLDRLHLALKRLETREDQP